MIRIFSLLVIFILGSANIVSAQNFIEKRAIGEAVREITGNSASKIKNSKMRPPNINKMNGNPNTAICPAGEKCVDPDYQEIVPSAQGRVNNFNYYGSMMGFAAGMKSQFHVDRTLKDYLPGDLTLAYITMGLTEPAVAAGLSQAVNYIGNDVNNRLQGEQAFFSQLQYMPEIAQSVGQAHINCISKQIGDGQTWMAAQAQCTGDTADFKDKLEFKDDGKILPTAFVHDGNHPRFGNDPSSDDDFKILLSQYLFERDAKSSGGGPNPMKELQTAFTEIIGDIEYKMDNALSGPKKRLGTRNLSFRKLPPTKSGSYEQALHLEMRNVHRTLLDLFAEVCAYTPPNGYNEGLNEPFLKSAKSSTNPKILAWAEATSFGGFTFDSLFAKALYELKPPPERETPGDSSNCPDYATDYEFDELVRNPDRFSTQGRELLFVSRLVATGRLYSMFLIAEQYIRKLNVGAFDNFARQAAFELLYEVAGSSDIQSVYTDNIEALRAYQDGLYARLSGEQRADKMPPSGTKDGASADAALPGSSGAL